MATIDIDYAGVDALESAIQENAGAISTLLDELATTMPDRIGVAYSGEAASTSKSTLASVSGATNEALSKMIGTFTSNLLQDKSDYQQQDKNLEESVNIPTMDIE